MTVSPGTTLGPYEIVALIGQGATGEVYRARDPRLNRDVAIKILTGSFSAQTDRFQRFQEEARATSALNHPNIVSVYDAGIADGLPYIVVELLEGETLRQRLEAGPIPARKAVACALEMARGLAAAHAAGIVHRDLKPENLFLTRDGRIKILDFGLAKSPLAAFATAAPESSASGPTLTLTGALIGTIGYMAPEMVRGLGADYRADLFSFGAILYEMLSGRRAFLAPSAVETMNSILKEEPPRLGSIERAVPPALERIVNHCLEKDPVDRFSSTRDLCFALEALAGADSETVAVSSAPARRRKRRVALLAGILVGGMAFGALLTLILHRPKPVERHALRHLTYSGRDYSPAVSRDGRTVAFTSGRDGRPRIWLKQLPAGGEIALTSGPDDFARFSPDGSMLLFSRTEGWRTSLYRTPVLGSEPRKLLEDVVNADWSPDARQIAFVRLLTEGTRTESVLGMADSDGGNARIVARFPDERVSHPRWSPDGATIAAVPQIVQAGVPQSILLIDPKTGQARRLATPPGGYGISSLAWSEDSKELLYAQAESATGYAIGNAGSSADVIRQDVASGAAQRLFWSPYGSQVLDIAGSHGLVFDTRSQRESLREYHPAGETASARWLTHGNSNDRQPAYSPDGEWVMFSSNRGGNLDLWQLSTKTGAVRRITDDPSEEWDPAFTADGKHILWSSNRGGKFEIWIANADGGGSRQVTRDGVDAENPTVTPDGEWIVYASGNPSKLGLWKVRRDGSDARRLVAGTISFPEVSPDGEWIAFVTNTRPEGVSLRVVRTADGTQAPFEAYIPVFNSSLSSPVGKPRWMPDGRALAFVGQDERGTNGVFVQNFVPGKDTGATRRKLGGFDPETATESFGISRDGTRLTIAVWDQVFALILAERVAGFSPAGQPATLRLFGQ